MWRTSSDNGPYFSADGRPYFMINGQPVWASSGQINPGSVSSSRGIAPSVAPLPINRRASAPILQFIPASNTSQQYENKINQWLSDHSIRRRSAIDPAQNWTGPPLNSPFMKQYNDYKDCDFAAEAAEDQYKSYLKSAGKVSTKMKQNSPRLYDGELPQTKDWHQSAAQYASLARDKYDEAANSRGRMATDYIGYDSQAGAAGHKERKEILRGKEEKMDKKYSMHSNTHN
ncbi:hypothetical protein MAJ_10624, partial [Metarhizium majus ARSEF 297]